jgi:hypothetical protein
MIFLKHPFLRSGIVVSSTVILFCSNLEAQNYSQTTHTPGYRQVYINTGPQNPLLNNLQAGWETDNIQAQAELARAQAAQIKIQSQLMIEQANQQQEIQQQEVAAQRERRAMIESRNNLIENQKKQIIELQLEQKLNRNALESDIKKLDDKVIKENLTAYELYTSFAPIYLDLDKSYTQHGLTDVATNDIIGLGKAVWDYAHSNHPDSRSVRESCMMVMDEKARLGVSGPQK